MFSIFIAGNVLYLNIFFTSPLGKMYLKHVTECLQRFGVWADWNNAYLTLDPEYEAAQVGGTAFLIYPFRCVK